MSVWDGDYTRKFGFLHKVERQVELTICSYVSVYTITASTSMTEAGLAMAKSCLNVSLCCQHPLWQPDQLA
jgi:hypothetical protein